MLLDGLAVDEEDGFEEGVAGHSVEVLLEVYAKCLDGQDQLAMRQVQHALGHRDPAEAH